jgi:hypothetical protein
MPELTTIADERSPRDEYVERGGRIYHKPRRSRHWRLVANFVARVEDEGVRDGVRYAKVTAVLQDKRTLTVSMPATEFARMRWVIPSLGPTAIISAGSGIKNYVRHAIQTLSISGAALNES